jgi:hypothetical protein
MLEDNDLNTYASTGLNDRDTDRATQCAAAFAPLARMGRRALPRPKRPRVTNKFSDVVNVSPAKAYGALLEFIDENGGDVNDAMSLIGDLVDLLDLEPGDYRNNRFAEVGESLARSFELTYANTNVAHDSDVMDLITRQEDGERWDGMS